MTPQDYPFSAIRGIATNSDTVVVHRDKKRPVFLVGALVRIPLTHGYETIVDASDLELVVKYDWFARVRRKADGSIRTVYAVRSEKVARKVRMVGIHRAILNAPDSHEVDHIDGDGLNNRRSNLRLASRAQNQKNRARPVSNSSGVKGVTWHAARGKWQAQISADNKHYNLGRFDKIEDAAAAYAAASAKLHGEFGRVS
jgi:hypothetical protein